MITVGLVDAINQVQAAGTTRSGTTRKNTTHVGFSASGKGANLFVPGVDPLDFALGDRIGHMVKCVAYHTIDVADTCRLQNLNDDLRSVFTHDGTPTRTVIVNNKYSMPVLKQIHQTC